MFEAFLRSPLPSIHDAAVPSPEDSAGKEQRDAIRELLMTARKKRKRSDMSRSSPAPAAGEASDTTATGVGSVGDNEETSSSSSSSSSSSPSTSLLAARELASALDSAGSDGEGVRDDGKDKAAVDDNDEDDDHDNGGFLALGRDDTKASGSAGKASARDSRPAMFTLSSGSGLRNPLLRLHEEMLDFCDLVSATKEEREARTKLIEEMRKVIGHVWAGVTVGPDDKPVSMSVFGSTATGLYLPTR